MTKGVVSAYRLDGGMNFLQSDVSITFGNSGGPLLDDSGRVVGVADLVYRPTGHDIQTGISFFVPVADALASIKVQRSVYVSSP